MTEQFRPQSSFGNETQRDPHINAHGNIRVSEMISQVRADIDAFVEGIDVKGIAKRIEEFGKTNPVGLAFTALTIGIAAGFLMKNPKTFSK